MRFVIKHINEGFFKTSAQMKKQIEREESASDEETLAKVGLEMLNAKIPEIAEACEEELIDVFGYTSMQDYHAYERDTTTVEVPFVIPNLYPENATWIWSNDAENYNDLRKVYPSPVREITWDNSESAYIIKLTICDYAPVITQSRSMIFGNGINNFVDNIKKIEKKLKKRFNRNFIIRLVRVSNVYCTNDRESANINKVMLNDYAPFPLYVSSVRITNRIDFNKLYDLFSMFDSLSGEVVLRTLYISGADTIASLDDLPILPFRTHEISFVATSTNFVPNNDTPPLLSKIGNFRRLLDPKNFMDFKHKMTGNAIIHPCITFDALAYSPEDLETLTNGVISKEYYNKVKTANNKARRMSISYNPYTNKIEII